MKKIFVLVLLSISMLTYSQSDFRSVNWGMSENEVKSIEKANFIGKSDTGLSYSLELNSVPMVLIYYFIDHKLFQAGYMTAKEYTDANKYFYIYDDLKKSLVKKYGKVNEIKRVDKYYEDNLDDGLILGKVTYMSEWQNDKSSIYLTIGGGELSAKLLIFYQSKEYIKLLESQDNSDGL